MNAFVRKLVNKLGRGLFGLFNAPRRVAGHAVERLVVVRSPQTRKTEDELEFSGYMKSLFALHTAIHTSPHRGPIAAHEVGERIAQLREWQWQVLVLRLLHNIGYRSSNLADEPGDYLVKSNALPALLRVVHQPHTEDGLFKSSEGIELCEQLDQKRSALGLDAAILITNGRICGELMQVTKPMNVYLVGNLDITDLLMSVRGATLDDKIRTVLTSPQTHSFDFHNPLPIAA